MSTFKQQCCISQLNRRRARHIDRFSTDNMVFDCNVMASYLCNKWFSASLFSLTNQVRWSLIEGRDWQRLISKPLREQRICHYCSVQAFEDKQFFLFDCPFYSVSRGQHFSLVGPDNQQRTDIRLLSSRTAISLVLLHTTCTYTCAFKPRCLGHNWPHVTIGPTTPTASC